MCSEKMLHEVSQGGLLLHVHSMTEVYEIQKWRPCKQSNFAFVLLEKSKST